MTASQEDTPVRVRNAAELFSVLSTGAPLEQMAVLLNIIKNPEKPISLGPHQGEDLVDLLLRLIPGSSGSLKQAQTVCLMCYQDERTTKFLVEEFARCLDPALVLRLAHRIHLDRDIEFFRPFLWGEKTAQALAAARLCRQLQDLNPAERLRMAILIDQEVEPPDLEEQHLDLWMAELGGRHRLRVRQLAERQPDQALIFWTRWRELAPREQEWLLALTARCRPGLLQDKLPELLEDPHLGPLAATLALELELNLPVGLLDHHHPRVRAAAILGGQADHNLDPYFRAEASLEETLAALGRCQPKRLVDCLSDERWQVRGAASQRLCQLEDPPVEEIRLKSESPDLGTKVAALRVLEHFQH